MRVLIVYASKYGHTRLVAERLADAAGANGAEVHLFAIDDVPSALAPHTADVCVVAAPVYFDKHPKSVERFAVEQRANLAKIQSVFVSVSGAARSEQGRVMAGNWARELLGRTGWMPDRVELVAGGEPYTKYNWLTRWFMARVARKLGRVVDTRRDYDFTDWSQVERLGVDLARGLDVAAQQEAPSAGFQPAATLSGRQAGWKPA